MIVRDEAAVIARCLASVRHLVDCFVIVDTGSTDETCAIVWNALAGLPGMLVSRPWVDFGHNRSEALALARPHAAYSLMIDAGDEVLRPDDWTRPKLADDSYLVDIHDGSSVAQGARLFANTVPWRYVGVLYEFPVCPQARRAGSLPLVVRRRHDGRRRRDAATSRDDAAILETALRSQTDPDLAARYAFYLAQSYRDCGDREAALAAYLHRATLGSWDQEVFVSLYEAARLMEALGQDIDSILTTYRRATEACPTRAEAAHGASRLCRLKGRHAEGWAIAKASLSLELPATGLDLEPWIYRSGLRDEFAVNAYWSHRYLDCLVACKALLALDDLPEDDRARFAANAQFARERIAEHPVAVPNQPVAPIGEDDLLVSDLRRRLGASLDAVNLRVNGFDDAMADGRPLVVWIHDDIDRASVQWLRDREMVGQVERFVFVSAWLMGRHVAHFGLPSDQCRVLRAAVDAPAFDRSWRHSFPLKVAYVGDPGNGLAVLLDALERLPYWW